MSEFINIENPFRDFKEHFEQEGNQKILFSGKYGIGKTFFLENFFESLNQSNSHTNCIFLNPINYAVKNNDDVFDLIKADILFSLFKKGLLKTQPDIDVNSQLILYNWLHKNWIDLAPIFLPLLEKIDIVGEKLSGFISLFQTFLSSVGTNYKKSKQELENALNSEQIALQEHWDRIESLKGTPYEKNIVNQVINAILNQFQIEGESVLIIDDLDRMDPEHVFRILNIFSAHDYSSQGINLFNFNKIILVCDVQNIEKMFYHKYGQEVDFEGYIDKFYSYEIFHFQNKDAINLYLSQLTTAFSHQCNALIIFLLKLALNKGLLTIRQLIKHISFSPNSIKNIELIRYTFDPQRVVTYSRADFLSFSELTELYLFSDSIELIKVFYFFRRIFGSFEGVAQLFESLKKTPDEKLNYSELPHNFLTPVLWFYLIRTNYSNMEKIFFSSSKSHQDSLLRPNYPVVKYEGAWELKILPNQSDGKKYFSGANFTLKTPSQKEGFISKHDLIKELSQSLEFFRHSDFFALFDRD